MSYQFGDLLPDPYWLALLLFEVTLSLSELSVFNRDLLFEQVDTLHDYLQFMSLLHRVLEQMSLLVFQCLAAGFK